MGMFMPRSMSKSAAEERSIDARTAALLVETCSQLMLQMQTACLVEDPCVPGLTIGQTLAPFYKEAYQELLLAARGTAMMIHIPAARHDLEKIAGETHGS